MSNYNTPVVKVTITLISLKLLTGSKIEYGFYHSSASIVIVYSSIIGKGICGTLHFLSIYNKIGMDFSLSKCMFNIHLLYSVIVIMPH